MFNIHEKKGKKSLMYCASIPPIVTEPEWMLSLSKCLLTSMY